MKMKQQDLIRFGLYLAVIVIINLVSSSLFFRLDLTKNKIYTLSDASVHAVDSLQEPLTLRFFLSEDLPQPNHNLEQEVRDLMDEYSQKGNRNFNYEILMIDSKGERTNDQGIPLTEVASKYGISAVSTQAVSDNQMSLVNVYMGMVMIQGDMSENINNLGIQDSREKRVNLESEITGMIQRLASKTNALLALNENIQVKLVFSSALNRLGAGMTSYPQEVADIVENLQSEYFQKLSFELIDPSLEGAGRIGKYGLSSFNLSDTGDQEPLYAALIVEKGDDFSKVELIVSSIFGSQIREPEELKDPISQIADLLLGVQQSLGYLYDHGTPPLYPDYYQQTPQQEQPLQSFYQLMSSEYQVKPVVMDELPEGMKTLVIAGPKQYFSDYNLYQIDQFLMKGGSLAIFLDPFLEQIPQQQNMFGASQPSYMPINTRLEELLAHYGVYYRQSYVMDDRGYVSRQRMNNGGIQEYKFYNAPEIIAENIDQDLPFMRNLKGMIMLNAAPLDVTVEESDTMDVSVLVRSSDRSWEMSENINLNPQMMSVPAEEEMQSFNLAVLLEGTFTSYFEGKDIPQAPVDDSSGTADDSLLLGGTRADDELVRSGEGSIFVVGTSQILQDNILDASGQSPNSMFILNSLDRISNREDYAVMRGKGQLFNPIRESLGSGTKTFIKVFNIAILPLLVILAGVLMWLRWIGRRKKIKAMFEEGSEE